MKTNRTLSLVALALLPLAGLACAGDDDAAVARAAAGTGCDLPQGGDEVDLKAADFTTDITNPWWPMQPGTVWTFEERDEEGAVENIVVTVTDETKEIAGGITARVVRDTGRDADGELIEDTDDWFAQDKAGNLWYFGEATAEYEGGEVVSTEGSWEHGVDGAMAGVAMPADPTVGCAYRQEFKEGEAEDNGQILAVTDVAETPAGTYHDVVSTLDTTPLEPDMAEHKFYAKDVGPVMTLQSSGGSARGVLISVTMD